MNKVRSSAATLSIHGHKEDEEETEENEERDDEDLGHCVCF